MSDILSPWARPQWITGASLEPSQRAPSDEIIFRHEVDEREPLPLSDRVSVPLVLKGLDHSEGEGHLNRETRWVIIRTRVTERLQVERTLEDLRDNH
jgi:hypothetical protein